MITSSLLLVAAEVMDLAAAVVAVGLELQLLFP